MKKDHKHHEEKMVTVAIHTYERAHILKSFLESEGIPAVIHGIRMIEPVIPGNVRVRINESDLPRALKIIEALDLTGEDAKTAEKEVKKEILYWLIFPTIHSLRVPSPSGWPVTSIAG